MELYSKEWGVLMNRHFSRDEGELVAYHAKMEARPTGEGRGLRVFSKAIERYREAGVGRIDTIAARVDDPDPRKRKNGYSFWAKCGFCLVFEPETLERLEGDYVGTTNTHELFERGGASWWERNGDTAAGSFDVDANSVHNGYLEQYKRLRGIEEDV